MASREISIKDQENQLHDMIHKNLSILSLIYPTSTEFKEKFKPGMFKKNNQPGSQQVVYFLLSIIDHEKIHERITCWPIRDVREESKFRMEVMRFYARLQEIYDDFGLKTLLSSHLITPGGYKFAKFILKLSDLALFVHLTKDNCEDDILLRPKPSQDTEMTTQKLNQLKIIAKNIKNDAAKLYEEHQCLNIDYNCELEIIDNKLLTVKTKLHELSKQDSLTTKNILAEDFKKSGMENYEDWLKSEIQTRLTKLNKISGKFKECSELIKYLLSKDNTLLYDKTNPITADIFSIAMDSDDKFNIIKFFETLLKYMQGRSNEVNFLPANFINPQADCLDKINNEQDQIHTDAQILLSNIAKTKNELIG